MDTRAFINAQEIAPLKTVTYLLNGYKTKPSIIKRRFLPVNAAISRLIDSSPSVTELTDFRVTCVANTHTRFGSSRNTPRRYLELLSLLLSEWLVSQ